MCCERRFALQQFTMLPNGRHYTANFFVWLSLRFIVVEMHTCTLPSIPSIHASESHLHTFSFFLVFFTLWNSLCRLLMTHNAFNWLLMCAYPLVCILWTTGIFFLCISYIVSLANEPVRKFTPIRNAVRRQSALHSHFDRSHHIHFQIVFDELSCAHFFPFFFFVLSCIFFFFAIRSNCKTWILALSDIKIFQLCYYI